MLRSSTLLLLAPLALLGACALAPQDEGAAPAFQPGVSVALGVGRTSLNDDWEPVEDLTVVTLDVASVPEDGQGFGWELGLAGGSEDESTTGFVAESDHFMLSGGVRHTWDAGRFSPYVGGGIEADHAELEITTLLGRADDDNTSLGLYLHAGFHVDLDDEGRWFMGLDGRWGGIGSEHDFDSLGLNVDSDYTRVTATVGLRF